MALRISLRELEVFVAVAKSGTVTKAADEVGLTQSAASQALAALEMALGVVLFDRSGRRLWLNEQGRLLLPRARAMLDSAYDLQSVFGSDAMSVKVGASTTIGNYLLPGLLASFRRDWSQAQMELTVANTHDIIQLVANFSVDVGFIEGACHHADLVVEPWLEDELVLFVASSHPLAQGSPTLEALSSAEWILREQGSGTREEVERLLLPHLSRFTLSMELGNSEAIKHAVAAGLGISCLSRRVIGDVLQAGYVSVIATALPPMFRTFYQIRHKDKVMTRGMETFLTHTALSAIS